MGCASSSPLAANGKIMEAAKGVANNAVHAGEDALDDVKSTVTETVSNVKEAVVEAVHNVGHGIESAISGNKNKETSNNGDNSIKDIGVMNNTDNTNSSFNGNDSTFTHIPLKDPTKSIDIATLDKVSEMINNKAEKYQSEAEKLADDLIKETDDIVADTIDTTNQHLSKSINQVMNSAGTAVNGSPMHSLNSLETSSPEPEIEKAMANGNKMNPPTPKPTFSELEKLQSEISSTIVNSEMDAIDIATAKFDSAVANLNGNNSEVLVSAEIYSDERKNREIHTRSNMDNYRPANLEGLSPCSKEKILNEETAWEKFADQLVKVPINKVKAYREAAQSTVKRSSSVDNIFKRLEI